MKKWTKYCFYGFWLFLIGSIFGYFFEGLLEVLKHGIWVSRPGLIYGPLSQVYGIGFVVIAATLYKIKNPIYLFLTGTVVGGTVEYILSLMQEYIFGTISWDYSEYFLNINGRTSLFHAICWGIISFVFMKLCFPMMMSLIHKLENTWGIWITIILSILLAIDIFLSVVAAIRQDERKYLIPPRNEFEHFIDKHYPDERMDAIYSNKKYRHEKNYGQP